MVVIRPILPLELYSVNHRFPSGPAAMPEGKLEGVGTGYSVTTPPVVIRPMLLPANSVNHRLPSGPAVMSTGPPPAGYSVMAPSVVIRPMLLPPYSVNHRFPS